MVIPIEKVLLHKLNMKLKFSFANSLETVEEKQFFIVEVVDGNGVSGFGESVAFTSPWYTEETVKTVEHMVADFLIPLLFANNIIHPDDVARVFKVIRRNHMAKASLEGAVWDLYAKQHGMALSQALGGKKSEIEAGIAIGIQQNMKQLLTLIEKYAEDGYKRIKLKIKPDWDYEMVKEVRKHFPSLPLMIDANSAYTLADIEHLKKLDDFELLMIEQPLGADDLLDHAVLQKVMKTPICLDESIQSLEDVKKAVALQSCKVMTVKSGRVGGLTESRKIHDYCNEHNIAIWCGGMLEAGVGRAHNIALSSLVHFTLPGDTGPSFHYWEEDIISPEIEVRNGKICVPEQPGIGFEINRKVLEKYTVDKKEFNRVEFKKS